jgi:hypothetical protein
MANILLSLFVTFGLALSGSSNISSATQAERETVLAACAAEFGASIDPKHDLFEVNRYYLLEARFDDRGRLAQLGVLPKHWFADDHPEWDETDDVGELTEIEYVSLVDRLESIRSKGRLERRGTESVVAGTTLRSRDIYTRAVLETGDVVDATRPGDSARAIKYFVVYYRATRTAN